MDRLKTGRISILLAAKIIKEAQSHSGKKLARIAYSYLISPQNHKSEIFLLNTDSRSSTYLLILGLKNPVRLYRLWLITNQTASIQNIILVKNTKNSKGAS